MTPVTQVARDRHLTIAALQARTPYRDIQSLPELWAIAARQWPTAIALLDPHTEPEQSITFGDLHQRIQQWAAAMQALGLQAGDHVALFAENQPRWMIADQGVMTAGAVDAVRGANADRAELLYILQHSDSVALIIQDEATLKKLLPELATIDLRFVALLTDETPTHDLPYPVLNFSQVMALGLNQTLTVAFPPTDSLATLMYTSGTSGEPKGVMLTHRNLLAQVFAAGGVVQPQPGNIVLSLLPIWHCYERTFEYFTLSWGCTQIYTNIRYVKRDLQTFQPQYMVGVPRLWESIYEGVQKQLREQSAGQQRLIQFFLGVSQRYIIARRTATGLNLNRLHPTGLEQLAARLRAISLMPLHAIGDRLIYRKIRAATGGKISFLVSGGGSLAEHLEDFFEIIGVPILGGYGLTETAPITNVRRPERNLRSADGQPLAETEIRIVHPETRQPVAVEQQGLVLIRGPQVMQGYYKNPTATAKVIDGEGWFDSGDLGWVTAQDDLILTGRAKDTIVLTNGENIEPQPIEDVCLRSPYIDQIMLVGQDQRAIGALIVPNLEALQQWAVSQNYTLNLPGLSAGPAGATVIELESDRIQALIRQELTREVQNRPGYRADDRITVFRLLLEPFSVENGMMTQTLKIRRAVVQERYRGMIDAMYA